jgi:hypothetical protein
MIQGFKHSTFVMIMILILSLIIVSAYVKAETFSEQSFIIECADGIKQNSDWIKIYDNGYGSKIKIVVTSENTITREKYNKDLTESDIVIAYSRNIKELTILQGRNIDTNQIRVNENIIRQEFYTNPCNGFKKFIDVASKEDLKTNYKNTTSEKVCYISNSGERICTSPEDDVTQKSEAECAKEFAALKSITASNYQQYRSISYYCETNIYGARTKLMRAYYHKAKSANMADESQAFILFGDLAYDETGKFPEIQREALYNIIILRSNDGDCTTLNSDVTRYNVKFKGQKPDWDAEISQRQNACINSEISKSKCKKLYPTTDGNKIYIVLIPDGYTDINTFIVDAKSMVENGLFQTDFMKQYRDKFNIYYFETLSMDLCVDDPDGKTDKPCDFDKVWPIEKQSPEYFKNIVISKKNFRSYASMAGGPGHVSVSSRYGTKEDIFIHELSHNTFYLADEYPEAGRGDLSHAPNCFNDGVKAKEYWEKTLGLKENVDFNFFLGCSYLQFNVMGTERSIMNSRSKNFGPINEAYIKQFMMKYD